MVMKPQMNERTLTFLRRAYREYYYKGADEIGFPNAVESREFGYIPFGGGMVRHLSFKSRGEALAEILKQSPSSVYCSNARYERPTMPIEEKGWLGAELIFDIDATDIPTPCKKKHDIWYCDNCHASGKLPRPTKCPKCGGTPSEFHGTCEACLDAAKDHARRVADFLRTDFGVAPEAIETYFSGNRGYHLQVSDPRFFALDQSARAEVADYVRGASLPASQTMAAGIRRGTAGGAQGAGWTRRITGYVEDHKQNHPGTLQKLVSEAVLSQRAMVDFSVTTDIHRVFRLAGTLHGSTGMLKTKVDSIDDFDPQEAPVVIEPKPVKIEVSFYPRFRMKHTDFGPFNHEAVELPAYASISILTRGLGVVV